MAKKSYSAIDPSIWNDPWFIDLDNATKLVFIYLLTTDLKNCTGIYEIHRHTIASGSVQSKEDTDTALKKFAEAGKIYYESNHIIIANWMKRTKYNTPEVRKYVIDHIQSLPRDIKDKHPDIINVILQKAGHDPGQGTGHDPGQGTGQGGIMNMNMNMNMNKNKKYIPAFTSPDIKTIQAEIEQLRSEAVGVKLETNLKPEQIAKLIDKFGVDKLCLMVRIYYLWKMKAKKKRNDYLSLLAPWVEEKANEQQASTPPKPIKRDDLPDGWDTWTTEQKREYNLRRAK